MGQLLVSISEYWSKIQGSLFPWLEEDLEPLTGKQKQLVAILDFIQIERFVSSSSPGYRGGQQLLVSTKPSHKTENFIENSSFINLFTIRRTDELKFQGKTTYINYYKLTERYV